jgi:hypothetical protein
MARASFGQALRRFLARPMAYREGVIAYDGVAGQTDIGLSRFCLPVLSGKTVKVAVQLLPAAIEALNRMIRAQLFNAARFVHWRVPESKNPGSFSSRSR